MCVVLTMVLVEHVVGGMAVGSLSSLGPFNLDVFSPGKLGLKWAEISSLTITRLKLPTFKHWLVSHVMNFSHE